MSEKSSSEKSEVLLISGNAGQGKTTIAANLATVLARFGQSTIVMNADTLTPKLHYHFGIQIPRQDTYLHSSGLFVQFTPSDTEELSKEHKVIVDVPLHGQEWYDTGHPTILVTRPDFPSVFDTLRLIQKVPNIKGIIINQAEHDHCELSPGNIQHFTNTPILGVIPYEKKLREALKLGHPITELYPDIETTKILKSVAANLMNQQYKPTLNGKE